MLRVRGSCLQDLTKIYLSIQLIFYCSAKKNIVIKIYGIPDKLTPLQSVLQNGNEEKFLGEEKSSKTSH